MKLSAKIGLLFLSIGLTLARAQVASPERTFPVERFVLTYANSAAKLPDLAELGNLSVPLETRDGHYVARGQGGTSTTIKVSDSFPAGTLFAESALRQVVAGIVQVLNQHKIYGVFVLPSKDEIDPATKADLRKEGNRSLSLVIWVSQIAKIQTLAKGSRFAGDPAGANAAYALIASNSPLNKGNLLDLDELNDYLRHVNRQPGREVDATISNAGQPGEVSLDYLVSEGKPWIGYAQVSNTGNPSTGQWQERVGAVDNQLTNHDDIASLDYVTTSFSKANAVLGSYDIPIIFPDKLRFKAYASYGDFAAFEPNSSDTKLSGNSWIAGVDFTGAVAEWQQFYVDLSGGIKAEHFVANNSGALLQGSADLVVPHVYLTAERHSPTFSFSGSVGAEFGTSSNDSNKLLALGRLDTKTQYSLLRASFSTSAYLDPIFNRVSGGGGSQSNDLAQEISLSASETYVPGGDRLIPEQEQAVGGLYSVRGYPQSFVAGDDAFTASVEYRLHFGHLSKLTSSKEEKKGSADNKPSTLFGQPFNWTGTPGAAKPDWDLIARGFLDYGRTSVNNGSLSGPAPGENGATLLSTGVGLELQLKRNFSVRADWGVVLDSVHTGLNGTFQPGDPREGNSRVSVLATVLW